MSREVSACSTLGVVTCCEPVLCFSCEITEISSDHGLNRVSHSESMTYLAQKLAVTV